MYIHRYVFKMLRVFFFHLRFICSSRSTDQQTSLTVAQDNWSLVFTLADRSLISGASGKLEQKMKLHLASMLAFGLSLDH